MLQNRPHCLWSWWSPISKGYHHSFTAAWYIHLGQAYQWMTWLHPHLEGWLWSQLTRHIGRNMEIDHWYIIWGRFHRHGHTDHVHWTVCSYRRPVLVKDIYTYLISNRTSYKLPTFPYIFWKGKCPPKIIHFAWLVFYNKNLSWDNLRKRSWHGPSGCSMCETDEETNLHMFIKYPATMRIWYALANIFDFPLTDFESPSAALIWWSRQKGNQRFLILIFLWSAWKWRNDRIFNDSHMPSSYILDNIMTSWHMIYGSIW